jgi:hypothetical protein
MALRVKRNIPSAVENVHLFFLWGGLNFFFDDLTFILLRSMQLLTSCKFANGNDGPWSRESAGALHGTPGVDGSSDDA